MTQALIEKIRESLIGERQLIETSFGKKPLVYADYTASGRPLKFIEDYIQQNVLPFYANTHSESSFTGAQTMLLREQSRDMIRKAVGAEDDDQIIFCGSGATAAINKLIDILNLRLPADLDIRNKLSEKICDEDCPLVFIGPYEHHSNELPWRESIADVEVIPLNEEGHLDIKKLEERLKLHSSRKIIIGSFSAASNVTGVLTDVDSVSSLLHRYNALAFWDYAAAAPYVSINMNHERNTNATNSEAGDISKDAVFISPHKFVGGPGTPGVLVVKKKLLKNSVPSMPGGGTVLYVTPEDHKFIDDHQRREEGGTPAIVESIRAGLVFKLQQEVGTDYIEEKEQAFVETAMQRWGQNSNIEILGSNSAKRLSIISLRIKHGEKDLHYGFVVALLNDLFGIQSRGGCSCAGPYGHSLLGMDMNYSRKLEKEISKGNMILRPGWVRLNFNYFLDDETFEYLLSAVEMVAEHGWKLLRFYRFDKDSGTWRFQDRKTEMPASLLGFNFEDFDPKSLTKEAAPNLEYHLEQAESELATRLRHAESYELNLDEAAEELRWFVLPQEIVAFPTLEEAS
ncbi:MAG: aminotransferase class V-fold PLP-dependent enzyme [Gammaproteobacteria bacterium]|jgi:selenocysteine lyase/cysteine desulfurase|nr:aminotransferase class V-fold PLP-dependent enzyme [Gammaproteobacteria bacterium]MBT3860177.1 aminotransferase class V-fold PLP-dependent enzyme [Gammaproteobacteria bacterium]MBT3987469.1 aminotransferase class V-fold PLP-dependent enzyme [Gammaproteobacteria bacterium]MBT4255592.1 aminotransferase class V-fold PLP-dependent enzyme [Gammaproteobacteria bacterium]MBT4581793.1 aminotransferase class V-fold PLP-dependent enzyme [Gammaproteobacteria bacterium]